MFLKNYLKMKNQRKGINKSITFIISVYMYLIIYLKVLMRFHKISKNKNPLCIEIRA